jgi:hypothetical protein
MLHARVSCHVCRAADFWWWFQGLLAGSPLGCTGVGNGAGLRAWDGGVLPRLSRANALALNPLFEEFEIVSCGNTIKFYEFRVWTAWEQDAAEREENREGELEGWLGGCEVKPGLQRYISILNGSSARSLPNHQRPKTTSTQLLLAPQLHTFLINSSHVRPSHFSLHDSKLNCQCCQLFNHLTPFYVSATSAPAMHKAMGKCVPGLGSSSSGLPIDIRYEVRFHSVSGLLELEPGKTVLIGTDTTPTPTRTTSSASLSHHEVFAPQFGSKPGEQPASRGDRPRPSSSRYNICFYRLICSTLICISMWEPILPITRDRR